MHMKITLALSAALLCLTASIHARPIRESRELVERELFEPDMQERSLVGNSDTDMGLTSRDMTEDPLGELVARGRKRKPADPSAPKKPRKKRVKKDKDAPRSPKAPPVKTAPAPGLKGAAMDKHVNNLRKQKLAAKKAQRGGAPQSARKAERNQQRKDNRQSQKLQRWQSGPVAAGTHKILQGGILVQSHLPDKLKDRQALAASKKATRKATGEAKWKAMTPDQQKARTDKQAADRATHATAKAARLAAQKSARDTARTAKKTQMQGVRDQFQASIAGGSFPARGAKFTTATPKEGEYKGRDVRQALFNGYAAAAKGGVGHKKNGVAVPDADKHPKTFENRPNSDTRIPIPGMTGHGREFGMTKNSVIGYAGLQPNPTATRLITQDNGHGVHEFKGVVSHPLTTSRTDPARNDHVQVPGTR